MDSYCLRCLPMTKSLSIESGCVAGRETFFSCVSISLLKHTILKFMCALKKKSSFQKMVFSFFSQVTVCVICMVMHYSVTEAVLWLTVPSVTHKCVSYTIYFSVLEFLFLFLHAAEYMAIFFFPQNSEICLEFSNLLLSYSPSLFLWGTTILFSRIFVIVINHMNRAICSW